nr:Gag-Pol polyprotein [Tanacetum cinerariifolium]
MIDNHSMDRLVKYVLMMEIVMHTEKNDIVSHTEKTGMLMLVVETDVGGMTADGVDKSICSSDDVQPRQVDMRCAHALTELHWHDIHVDPDRHEVDQRHKNPIRTLIDYSRPSHEGYRNTIEHPDRNNVVPLRPDTIWLVQNGCLFHGLWSEDPNQHLKDFLKLVDSLDLDVANMERTRMPLFQFSLRDQTSNQLERLPAGFVSTWEDLIGSESRPPMLNKENYVPWSSRLLRYAKSRPNGKLIHNSILNGPYVRIMNPEPGDANCEITITETFHLQTDDELSEKELKQIKDDDQAIQTILLGLPEDIYTTEKKAKLFNEWERFTSNEGESIESYYHRFLKLMNDLKRNKHFPDKIASNLKFLNNLQPEWSRHVTIVYQTKDLHTADYTQLYDFLKYYQKEVDELKAKRLAKTQDPLALMANSNNPYSFPAPHQDQSSFNQNYLQQPMPNPKDITDPKTIMNMALTLMAKAFKLNYSTPTNNNQRISSNTRNRQIAQPGINMGQDRQMQMVGGNGGNQFRQYAGQNVGNSAGYNDVIGNQVIQNAVQNPRVQNMGNQNGLIGVQGNRNKNKIRNGNLVVARAEGNAPGQNGNQIRCYNCRGVGHYARNCTVRPRRRDAAYLQRQLLIAQKEEAGIQLQAEEYDLMAAAADLDEIEEVNANCILMANLQQASTSGTQTESAPVYDTDGSAKNDNNVISEYTGVEQGGEIVEQHPTNFEETCALYESLYQNLAIEVEKVNSVNHKLKETNADLTTELARFKNQERCFEISQEKYDKLE